MFLGTLNQIISIVLILIIVIFLSIKMLSLKNDINKQIGQNINKHEKVIQYYQSNNHYNKILLMLILLNHRKNNI